MKSNKTDGRITVVIPCYNHGRYLEETILSIKDSDYSDIEIIVVDDESKDDSVEVAKKLAEEIPHMQVLQQKNSGPSRARNYGIKAASGAYILPLDADDRISRSYIPEAIKVLRNNRDVKVVYCEAEKFGAKTGHWKLKPFSLANLARNNMIFVSGVFRKADWEACGGYSEDLIWGREDWEFWIKMLKNGGEVVKLPFVGFYYRINHNSRRKSQTSEKKRKLIAYVNEKHPEFFRKHLNGPLRFQRGLSKFINFFVKD